LKTVKVEEKVEDMKEKKVSRRKDKGASFSSLMLVAEKEKNVAFCTTSPRRRWQRKGDVGHAELSTICRQVAPGRLEAKVQRRERR
jgi:hypothetical protein